MAEEIKEFDESKNCIYYKSTSGFERWCKYDKNNNLICYKSSDGYESWREYDENNNIIHHKNTYNNEYWYKYNEYNKQIEITQQEFNQIERKREKQELYLNIKNSNRFEIMDI